MRYVILTNKGFIISCGSTKVYIDYRTAIKDMNKGNQLISLPRVGRNSEEMKLVWAMRRYKKALEDCSTKA